MLEKLEIVDFLVGIANEAYEDDSVERAEELEIVIDKIKEKFNIPEFSSLGYEDEWKWHLCDIRKKLLEKRKNDPIYQLKNNFKKSILYGGFFRK